MAYKFNPFVGNLDQTLSLSALDDRYVNVTGDSMTGLLDISLETADTNTTAEVLTFGRTSTTNGNTGFGSEIQFTNQITSIGSPYPVTLDSSLRGTRLLAGSIRTKWKDHFTAATSTLTLSAYVNGTTEREAIVIDANTSGANVSIGSVTSTSGLFSVNIGRGTVSAANGSILLSNTTGASITGNGSVGLYGGGVGSITSSASVGIIGSYGYVTGTYNSAVGSWVRADGSSHSHTYGSGNAGATAYLDNNIADSILMGANGNQFVHFRTDYNLFKAVSATHIPGVFQGTTSQTANLTEWQNGSGSVLGARASNGYISVGSGSPTYAITVNDGTVESSAVPGLGTASTISAQGATAAYFMGRATSSNIEFIMGVSASSSAVFNGSMTNHPLQFRTNNVTRFTVETSGRISFNHSTSHPIETITASSDTLDDTNHIVLCDATSNAITINLPAASGSSGLIYHIKKVDSSINIITIDPNGSELIDGDTTKEITEQHTSVQIVCDGSAWYVI